MIVYLDQNKWIELAKIFHGKDKSERAISIQRDLEASIEHGYIYPLSAIHYMEFARIRNNERRTRLGQVMWKYSGGRSLISARELVEYEIEVGLQDYIPEITPRNFNLIGNGISHAFGEKVKRILPEWFNIKIEEAILTGFKELNIDPISFVSEDHRLKFKKHLEALQQTKKELNKSKWDDWLHAITLADILEPLHAVLIKNNLNPMSLTSFIAQNGRNIVAKMPTRVLDIHLHHQVLKNPQYKPKVTDLEDWAGLGAAACYCDIVVCEKHFADLISRDGFSTHARIETDLLNIFGKQIHSL